VTAEEDETMSATTLLAGAIAGPVLVSYLVEASRRAPAPPERLAWAPDVPIRYVDSGGRRLRYVVAGQGPPVVLLHTLRTQLDMFQKVVSELARGFTVYALDYPGHGWSDIPPVEYTVELFVEAVAGFLDRLQLEDVTLVGESIGGAIALLLAARHHPRVGRVVAVNPYDYDRGRGLRRSSALANVIFGLNDVPVVGATLARFRMFPILARIFAGGVVRPQSLPPALLREMYLVGNRRGHARAFASLVHHWPEWERARSEYGRIDRPALLLYGDHDWSRPDERAAEAAAVPGARERVVPGAGHFLSLDAPEALVQAVRDVTAREISA
jgi:pimeloyl-ACP methyl ester carboxylesterase